MDEDIVRLRAELGEAQAQAAFASLVAEVAFSIATRGMPAAERSAFLSAFAERLKAGPSRFPQEAALAARTAGLFAAFARRHKAPDEPG